MLYSYLNNQHIRKQKISEAELNYGSLVIDHAETMKEIGLGDERADLFMDKIQHKGKHDS